MGAVFRPSTTQGRNYMATIHRRRTVRVNIIVTRNVICRDLTGKQRVNSQTVPGRWMGKAPWTPSNIKVSMLVSIIGILSLAEANYEPRKFVYKGCDGV